MNDRVVAEARTRTPAQRLADLDALTQGCATWRGDPESDAALAAVRARWIRLKTIPSSGA